MNQVRVKPSVSLVLVDTHFYGLSRIAVERSVSEFRFDDVLVFTDAPSRLVGGATAIEINKIASKDDYNKIILEVVPNYVCSDFVMIVQYDGFVLDRALWHDAFLEFDYIGAPWPNFTFHTVGNGGFSLRSRRLMQWCSSYAHLRMPGEAEDVFIARTIRPLLESRHCALFAPPELALGFSFESPGHPKQAFGFHGVLNLPIAYRGKIEWFVDNAPRDLLRERAAELMFGAQFIGGDERSFLYSVLAETGKE